jgi:hypothetical protein
MSKKFKITAPLCTGHGFNVPIRSDGESIRRGDVVKAHHGFLLDTAAGGGGLQDRQHHVEAEGFWDHSLKKKYIIIVNKSINEGTLVKNVGEG